MSKNYEDMTVAELEAEIGKIIEREREGKEEKRAIQALITEKLPAEREAWNAQHQAEALAVAEAASGEATSANVDAPSAAAHGGGGQV